MPSHFSGDKGTVEALYTYVVLARAANALERRIVSTKIFQGLTLSQFSILETLYFLGPQFQGELSHKLLRSTGNITFVLDNLERQKLISREHNFPDHRLVRIHLTEEGEQLIKKLFPKVARVIKKEISILSSEEQSTLRNLIKIVGKGKRE